MSTKKVVIKKAPQILPQFATRPQDDSLVNLMATMKSVKTKGKRAKKNEVAQDDNNGLDYLYGVLDKHRKDQNEDENE
ncbi:hypothetical protein GYA19_02440 [Candidatus Beckwithbacteria bacterium]|nr:hypothetical protein [Candidatus Beckwithbacteria bacterium]